MNVKQSTREEYEKAINRAVDYINQHLYESPDLYELADIANMSAYHFHRIFKDIMGENPGKYIIRLRLEDIAQRLRMTPYSLDIIAEETGYQTKFALSKAFKKYFGITPSAYRNTSSNEAGFFKNARKEGKPLSCNIREIQPINLIYVRMVGFYGSAESYAKGWMELGKFASRNKLINSTTEYIGVSFDDPTITNPAKCRFYACMTAPAGIKPAGVVGTFVMEGGIYAVFTHKGAYHTLLDTYYNIYTIWLPTSGYKLRNKNAFEKYVNKPGEVTEENLVTEIYIPVRNKE